jgi:ABC-type dipeptide/oligopeptide/nickel transport system permease component
MAGEERDPEVIELLREKYRLNDPIPMQYLYWVGGVLQGDLGTSLRTGQPVLELIGQKLPVTIQLAIMSMIFAFAIGVPAGILSAVKKGTWDRLHRQCGGAVGPVDPELLAGDHDDPAGVGEPGLAARLGL